jgi:hypothetical protein
MQGFGVHGGFPKTLAGMRIQQAIPAKHKSPACQDLDDISVCAGVPANPASQKTRPPA